LKQDLASAPVAGTGWMRSGWLHPVCERAAELSHARNVGVRGLLGRVGDGDGSGGMTDGDMQKRGHDRDLDVEREDEM
jgi:hypothetical protein